MSQATVDRGEAALTQNGVRQELVDLYGSHVSRLRLQYLQVLPRFRAETLLQTWLQQDGVLRPDVSLHQNGATP